MHPIPLPTLQNAAGGPFWAVMAAFCGDFDAGCVVVCCAGAGRASSIHVIGLLDVRVLEVLDVFLKNGCWMFLKALRSSIRMRSKCCAFGFRFLDRRSGGVVPGIHSFLFSITGRN